MPKLRTGVLVAAALCIGAKAAPPTASCSTDQVQQVQTLIAEIRSSLDSTSSSQATIVPSTCKSALTYDQSTTNEDGENCANDCVAWVEEVLDAPTCEAKEMIMYQRRMAAYLTQCNENNQAKVQETNELNHSSRLRGLAEGSPEKRPLGVKGLMDALLVVTLNNAL